ncbi:hypothetical protein [uncultured Phascolarctobacterium sp.]|uniref:hypothetical protein n=1 Tax=uncultured Phascolarctobacterium sp. TaxID=512296 RepID=UPI00260AB198|nr:hypothetical protein [uncultured Phascolarctobacterium sp.]
MNKNYCGEHEVKQNAAKKATWHEKMQAFSDYLGRPKTVFDLKDRSKALLLLAAIIIGVQYLLKVLLK